MPSPSCPLLEKLPVELRIEIYEYIWSFEPVQEEEPISWRLNKSARPYVVGAQDNHPHCSTKKERINFLNIQLPCRDLLLTCRQIYTEAVRTYKTAYRSFWETTHFELGLPETQTETSRIASTREILASFNIEDLNHMSHATVYPTRSGRFPYDLIDTRGGWTRTNYGGMPKYSYIRLNSEAQTSNADWPHTDREAQWRLRHDVGRIRCGSEEDMIAACCEDSLKVPMSYQLMRLVI